jgi:hypothetical protein
MIEVLKQALEAIDIELSASTSEELELASEKLCDARESLRQAIREHAIYEVQRLGQELEQEPVAMLERDPSIGRLRVTYEDAVTELDEGVYPLYTKPQGWRDNVAQAYLKGFDEGERRYRWLRKEYAESRETYLAECVPSENALDEYIDRQMAKTSIKTERWSGK